MTTDVSFAEPPMRLWHPVSGEPFYVALDEREVQKVLLRELANASPRRFAPGERTKIYVEIGTGGTRNVLELEECAVYEVTTTSGAKHLVFPKLARATVDALDDNDETRFVKMQWMCEVQKNPDECFRPSLAFGHPSAYLGALADSMMRPDGTELPVDDLFDTITSCSTKRTERIYPDYRSHGTRERPYKIPTWLRVVKRLSSPKIQAPLKALEPIQHFA